jgi:hypothetical protein
MQASRHAASVVAQEQLQYNTDEDPEGEVGGQSTPEDDPLDTAAVD